MVLVVTSYLRIRRKWKESKEIESGQVFVYAIAYVRSNGFERVAVLPIGLVRKAPTLSHPTHLANFLQLALGNSYWPIQLTLGNRLANLEPS